MLEAAGVKNVRTFDNGYTWAWVFMKWEQHEWAEIQKHQY